MTMTTDGWQLSRTFDFAEGTVAWDVLGDGPPVVLLHGTPSWSYLWRHVAPALAASRTVYVYDLVGYGTSEQRAGQDVSIATQARLLVALLQAWGLEQPDVVGHDIGGATALRAHLVHGAPYRRLALVDAVAIAPWITPLSRHVQAHLEAYQTMPQHVYRQILATHLRTAIHRPMSDAGLIPYLRPWGGSAGQAAYFRQVAQFDEDHTRDMEERYSALDLPVLVLWGQEDRWLDPGFGHRLTEAIPGSRFQLLPVAGHFAMEDDPAAVVSALDAFL